MSIDEIAMRRRRGSKIEDRKTQARAWFEALRDDICAAFETLEDEAPEALYPGGPGASCGRPGPHDQRRERRRRRHGDDARAAVREGRRASSTVHGDFAPEFGKQIRAPPRTRASGPRASR